MCPYEGFIIDTEIKPGKPLLCAAVVTKFVNVVGTLLRTSHSQLKAPATFHFSFPKRLDFIFLGSNIQCSCVTHASDEYALISLFFRSLYNKNTNS